jgi:hypothetical protein
MMPAESCPSPSHASGAGPSLSPHAGRGRALPFFSLAPLGGERVGVRGLPVVFVLAGG